MTVVIRSLAPDEWQTYRRMRLSALRESPSAFCNTLGEEEAWPEGTWRDQGTPSTWFAFVDGQAVGMARTSRDQSRRLPVLNSMWVAPSARGTTVATDLVRRVLEQARADGDRGVLLHVVLGNGRARALYERLGFGYTGAETPLAGGRVETQMEHLFA